MPGIDAEFGASLLRLWIAAGSAALLVLVCVLAIFQSQLQMAASRARRVGFVVAGAVLGAAMSWALLDSWALPDRAAAAHGDGSGEGAFALQAQELGARALSPGSALACLDGLAGESVEAACEKAVFASPASVAAAASYVAARLALLSGAEHAGANADDVLAQLRRSLEIDRFGIVAHVLALRDHCTKEDCKALALLRDPSRVQANLGQQAFDRYVEHYASVWSAGEAAVSEAASAQAATPPATPAAHKIVNIDFPSAASIPAVSIMNPEPSGPVVPGAAAAAAANPNPPAAGQPSARHTHKPPANAAATAPPPSTAGAAATEPIWPEPVPSSPSASPPHEGAPAAGAALLAPASANAGSGAAAHTP